MKVYGCTASNNVAGETHPLCWNDVKLRGSGVYEFRDGSRGRVIVVRSGEASALLYYDGHGILEPVYEPSWALRKFRFTGECVCFEIKP